MKFENNDVLQAMKNDNTAFANLYQSIHMDLYKMAYYTLGNAELAKDIVSETILDAYQGISKLRDADRFESWILTILTNKCKQMMKRKYSKFSIFNPNARNVEDYELSSPDDMEQSITRTDLFHALSHLSSEDKLIISLCIIEGYKSHEAAQILSMNPATLRSRLNRGLKKMKKYLEVKADEK